MDSNSLIVSDTKGKPSFLQPDMAAQQGGAAAVTIKLPDAWSSTLFEPQNEESDQNPAVPDNLSQDPAPEKKLTLLALRLAVLEKAASGLGTLGFIWATVVLLGGFASSLAYTDFWFITVILLIEGARIFSRSHELEWQHQATWTVTEAEMNSLNTFQSTTTTTTSPRFPYLSFRPGRGRMKRCPDAPLIPYAGNISRMLCWMQLLSASACISLSLMSLVRQDYDELGLEGGGKTNRSSALNIFYGLALAEALLFLIEKALWEWKLGHCQLLQQVNRECGICPSGMISMKRFFYDAYSSSVNGSIFDGLKMDLVTFGQELLASSSSDEQLIGARILLKFVSSHRFAQETFRKIGTSTLVMERLIEMLNWKNPAEEEIRRSAAEIVARLAGKQQNALRVAGIPGAMESIASLLHTEDSSSQNSNEMCHRCIIISSQSEYEFSTINLLGLLILKKLAHDHDNCGKIGNTRGLLPKIIDFTSAGERLSKREGVTQMQIKAVKRSLQIVKMLVSMSGSTGKTLRQEVSEIVFTMSNIREILQFGDKHMKLQKLGIEILTSLAMEKDTRERIGGTGGMIKELLRIYLRSDMHSSMRVEAGEVLTMLALESQMNCNRMLKEVGTAERLVEVLGEPELCVGCCRILQNVFTYKEDECFSLLKGVTTAIPIVLDAIMVADMKLLEVSLGLAAQIFRFLSLEEQENELKKANITDNKFVEKLVQVLGKYDYPSIKVPRIRRSVIELAIWMMNTNKKYIGLFKASGMEKELECTAETTSALECFNVFSGSVGLSQHKMTICSLIDTALSLIDKGSD